MGCARVPSRVHVPAVVGGEAANDCLVERIDAMVVELVGTGRIDRELLVCRTLEQTVAASVLLAHVAQGVERSRAVELVDRHEVGVVEHVDLLELHGGAVLGRHHIQREVGDVDDLGVRLADAGGLHQDEVEAGPLTDADRLLNVGGERPVCLPGGERAHEHSLGAEGVEPDPVAEQGAAGLALSGVDREDRDRHLGKVGQKAQSRARR